MNALIQALSSSRASLLGGVLLGVSFVMYPFFQAPFLAWVGFVPILLHLKTRETFGAHFRAAYLSMLCFTLVSVWWVALSTFLGGVLMYFAQTFFMTIPFVAFFFARKALGWNRALWLFPFIWTAWEWIYLDLELSFGWITLGNSHSNAWWLVQFVDLFGVWAISFWIVLFNVLVVKLIEEWGERRDAEIRAKILRRYAMALAILLALPLTYSTAVFLSPKPDPVGKIKVAIVQPNIDPFAKWENSNRRMVLEKHVVATDSAMREGADLAIWPETAIPYFILLQRGSEAWERLVASVGRWRAPLLSGFSDAVYYADSAQRQAGAKYDRYAQRYYDTFNAAMLLDSNGNAQVYRKMKLVPFAERVPYMEYLPFLSSATFSVAGISSWGRGKDTLNFSFLTKSNQRVEATALICYESIYPAFAAEFVRRGATMLTVITNDGWFSKSYGPYQHAAFAKLRCIETRRSMARCANTGVSLFIDRYGRAYGEVEWWKETHSVQELELYDDESFYVGHVDWFPKGCLFVSLAGFLTGLVVARRGKSATVCR
ncbi:MAG: apolipoprotein N-acyltransferase [Chloroherpetonaceae bacterium]|nr:apolipoprotein N-acyltransferase [Chloroherpetonaceae bacterium]MDW8438008.1 apolipoprotein N-acyltransferase [Chloroherpetonaceae bacterium]